MRTALALAACLLSGCVAPVHATRDVPQPGTLAEVNALLEGRTVDVRLVSGDDITGARKVTVDSVEIRFKAPGRPPVAWARLPIHDVELVSYVRNRGTRIGAAIGAAPGVLGALTGVRLVRVGALAGAVLGGWFGQAVSPGVIVTLYQGPVESYLQREEASSRYP